MIPAADCPGVSCAAATVYALCAGAEYSACDCDNPGGAWTEAVPDGGAPPNDASDEVDGGGVSDSGDIPDSDSVGAGRD